MLKFLREKKGPTLLFLLTLSIAFITFRSGRLIPRLLRAPASQGPVKNQSGNHPVTPADNLFLKELRKYIAAPQKPDDNTLIRAFSRTSFRQDAYGVILTAYQPGLSNIRVISTKKTTEMNILRATMSMRTNIKASTFNWNDPATCRIQIDFISELPVPININNLCEECLSSNRFEPGIDGLIAEANGKKKYFLPGDAFFLSISCLKSTIESILKTFKNVPETEIKWSRLNTQSFISYKNSWIELYRGEPVIDKIEKKI